jgi:hypothetical protein
MRYFLPLFLAFLALGVSVGSTVRADQPEPLEKLNVLIVLDTGDGVIGDTLGIDKKRILSLMQRQLPKAKVVTKTLEGPEAKRANITAYFKALKLDATQGVLFYYGGHGGATKAGQHFFVLSPDKYERFYRDDVQKLMEGTGAGLVVMLTDCCSDIPPGKARSAGLDKIQDVPKTNPKRGM